MYSRSVIEDGGTVWSQAAVGEEGANFLAVSGLQLAFCKAELKNTRVCTKQLARRSYIMLLAVVTNSFELGPPNSDT